MENIVKVCKMHGELTIKQIQKTIKRGKDYFYCRECKKNAKKKYLLNHFGKCPTHGVLDEKFIRKDGACKICHRATANKKRNENREWFNEKMAKDREKNPEKWKKIYKKVYEYNKNKYRSYYSLKKCCDARKITINQYNNLLEAQKNVCAICFEPETRKTPKTNIPMRLVIDHCHKTNKVRGLLCHSCNTAIGKFKDDPIRIFRSIRYIKEGGFHKMDKLCP